MCWILRLSEGRGEGVQEAMEDKVSWNFLGPSASKYYINIIIIPPKTLTLMFNIKIYFYIYLIMIQYPTIIIH